MMENVRQCDFDLEFYSSHPASAVTSMVNRGWKEPPNVNNNTLDSSGFSIDVSTGGESDLFIDDLIDLADENMSTTSSSVISTPSPVISSRPPQQIQLQQQASTAAAVAAASSSAPPSYHSRLHEALTQPRLPTQPVKCHRCGNELTSRCLMQTCADDTRCRQCGRDLTAKCILAVCTVQPKVENFDLRKSSVHESVQLPPPPRRHRVHHYSSPSN